MFCFYRPSCRLFICLQKGNIYKGNTNSNTSKPTCKFIFNKFSLSPTDATSPRISSAKVPKFCKCTNSMSSHVQPLLLHIRATVSQASESRLRVAGHPILRPGKEIDRVRDGSIHPLSFRNAGAERQ